MGVACVHGKGGGRTIGGRAHGGFTSCGGVPNEADVFVTHLR
jgi:hypothetical protein